MQIFETGSLQCRDIPIGGLAEAIDGVVKHVHVLGRARGSGMLIQDCRPSNIAVGVPVCGQKPQQFLLKNA